MAFAARIAGSRAGAARLGAGIAGVLAGTLACAGAAAADGLVDPPIVEARWVAPDADLVAELTTEPVECLAPAADAAEAELIEIGRAAFRAPSLLGGQAARAGLSCASCHRNGRSNPAFFFFGVSGAPGTADVTSSVFSSHRGDGVDNPVPIPDLAGPRAALKVDRSPGSGALEAFIRGLVVEEFDGHEPTPRTLEGLAAYVRALRPEACPGEARRVVSVQDPIGDAARAAEAGWASYARGDAETGGLMLSAARTELGRINDRYPGPELEELRHELRVSSELIDLWRRGNVGDLDPGEGARIVAAWRESYPRLARKLRLTEPRSLYDAGTLAAAARTWRTPQSAFDPGAN